MAMNPDNLRISAPVNGIYRITVRERANFDYAVPLRELAAEITPEESIQLEMTDCEAMDSTFMGVLTMLAIKLRKNGKKLEMFNASTFLQKLLKDLGVAKLFVFQTGELADNGEKLAVQTSGSLLTKAETVADAHKTLVAADENNAAKFDKVIQFAEADVKRLKQQTSEK